MAAITFLRQLRNSRSGRAFRASAYSDIKKVALLLGLDYAKPFLVIAAMIGVRNELAHAARKASGPDNPTVLRLAGFHNRDTDSRAIAQQLLDIKSDLTIATLGISLAESGQFRDRTKSVTLLTMLGGSWTIQLAHREQTLEEAQFCIGYVTSLALVAQDAFPSEVAKVSFKVHLRDQKASEPFAISWKDFDAMMAGKTI